VTYPQYLVLVALWERDSQGVGDLATILGMDLGTLSPMLKRIEKKGLYCAGAIRRTNDGFLFPHAQGRGAPQADAADAGEFYCFLNMPLEELFDLKDRLRRFVRMAGAKDSEAA